MTDCQTTECDTDNHTPPLPDGPCDELPGTTEKVERMRLRVEAQRQVFHPGDARWGGEVADKVGALVVVICGMEVDGSSN